MSKSAVERLRRETKELLGKDPGELETEWAFCVETDGELSREDLDKLRWLLSETFEQDGFGTASFLTNCAEVIQFGPRQNFETRYSTTSVEISGHVGIDKVSRIERLVRIGFSEELSQKERERFLESVTDKMTEQPYIETPQTFGLLSEVEGVAKVRVLEEGVQALETFNKKYGCGWDGQDIAFLHELFYKIERNPTNVELFQLSQANSEHSRHHVFRGMHTIDGVVQAESLMDIVKTPWKRHPANSVVAFDDDSSALRGFELSPFLPYTPGRSGPFVTSVRIWHPTSSWETHNHPCLWEPFNGALTCLGGWLRDIFAIRNGGIFRFAGAGYAVGNLHIPGYEMPWERDGWSHPKNCASPLDILIRASDGMSQYGNEFGIPLTLGWTRSFGMLLPEGYRTWHKPVVYGGGTGVFDEIQVEHKELEKEMLLVQIGGPGYRIGIGGGSASSMDHGANDSELDFNSVQRGDAFMENPGGRVIRACVELGEENPLQKIVDLGAGGLCNACPEISSPQGALVKLRQIPVGDVTLSVLEIWGNEAQERWVMALSPDKLDRFREICEREGCPYAVIGRITGDGFIILHDESDGSTSVNLPLNDILENLPKKKFEFATVKHERQPADVSGISVFDALSRVLHLPSVCSKHFLTVKADRSVTGLIAQQQCVGPNQLPLANASVAALDYFDVVGLASSLGERPLIGLISVEAMVRMAVAEALLNMGGVSIPAIDHIKCSANWMLAVREPGEGANLFRAAYALRDILLELGIAIDGGKDSLSMASKSTDPSGETAKAVAPMQLVIANYADVPDIRKKVNPDIKSDESALVFVDLSEGHCELGGSALLQALGQIGDRSPDVRNAHTLARAFSALQELLENDLIHSYHDVSDGGMIVTMLEMAFAGNVGLDIDIAGKDSAVEILFTEELGFVIEVDPLKVAEVIGHFHDMKVQAEHIGKSTAHQQIVITYNEVEVLNEEMRVLRAAWEQTSTKLDKRQANPECVEVEAAYKVEQSPEPPANCTFTPSLSYTPRISTLSDLERLHLPKVAIIREKGSNGDREMAAAFTAAGFEAWDVTMTDLSSGKVSLEWFRGIVFVGGFSYGDVLGAAKGWAGSILFNERLREEFDRFYSREDTFSLGVCNGCQLMALLGWAPFGTSWEDRPRFIRNISERFESRFSWVRIMPSPAIMLSGMEGSVLGVWTAHGEGRLHTPMRQMMSEIVVNQLAPIRYVDDWGRPTQAYPCNPNGSPEGITALCSPDGRHLAMMPHPERLFQIWQWPYWPKKWQGMEASPWLRFFQNARKWCEETR